jgi:hypothetical protein
MQPIPSDESPSDPPADESGYTPNWVLFGDRPEPTYAEKLAAYQADQALRMTSSSRAEYERRKAELQKKARDDKVE